MPHGDTPWIKQDRFLNEDGRWIYLDTPAWFVWLETANIFCYMLPPGGDRFTARKEKRRHNVYWYAYLKYDTKLHNAYLGKSENLTIAHLEQVGRQLLQKAVQARRERTGIQLI